MADGAIPESAHYRESSDPDVCCASCLQYSGGRCLMFRTEVDPTMVCDEWEQIVSDHAGVGLAAAAAVYVPASELNRLLQLGYKRAEELEPKLVALLQPILDDAGDEAARRFTRMATDHLTAALKGDTKADVESSSAMVALYPTAEQAASIAETDGEAPELMHVTLCYLGKGNTEEAVQRLAAALGPVAATHPPLEGKVGGIGSFGGDGTYPAIALPNVPGLVELRQAVCEAVLAAGGDYPRDHGFVPHLTVAYRDGEPLPPDASVLGLPLSFGSLHVVLGNEVVAELPLTGAPSLTAAAAAGWSAPAGDEIVDVDKIVSKLRTKTDPVRMAVVETMMTPVLGGAGIAFDATNPLAAKVLAQAGSQVTNIADTTRLNVMRIVKASHEQGLTIPDTAKAIRAGMKESSMARATLIARTEIVGAVNGGSLAATQIVSDATGVDYQKEWLTSPGAQYPRHEDYEGLDGQTVGLEDYFDVGGDQLQFPGDPDGSPEEVCNCRCTLIYVDSEGADQGGGGDAESGFQTPSLPTVATNSEASPVEQWEATAVAGGVPQGKEMAAVFRDGELVAEHIGEATSVAADTREGDVLTHTHPTIPEVDTVSLSDADVNTAALKGLREVRAVNDYGTVSLSSADGGILNYRAVKEWNGDSIIAKKDAEAATKKEGLLVQEKVRMDTASDHGLVYRVTPHPPSPVEAPRPVTKLKVAADPYTASLQKEKYSAGNKIANLVWKQRNTPEKFSASDEARLNALRTHEANLKAWLEPPAPGVEGVRGLEAEREFLLGELDYADRFYGSDASTPHYVKLVKARLEQLDALEKDALPAPSVFPVSKDLAADIAQIRSSAEFITPDEAAARFRDVLGTDASLPYRVPGSGASVPDYVKVQQHAVMAAGARMEDEIATMVARSDAAAGRRPLDEIFKDLQAADKETPEEARTFDAWYKLDRESRQLAGEVEDELSFDRYGSPFSMLSKDEQADVSFRVQKDPRVAPVLQKVNASYREMSAVKKTLFEKRKALQQEYDARRSGAALIERNAVVNALSQVREMGTSDTAEIRLTTSLKARFESETTGELEAQRLLVRGQEFLPSEWIEKFHTFETSMAERGMHYAARDGVSRIEISRSPNAVASDPTGLGTAVHELVHEVEDTNPMIVEAQRAFYEWRTRGGSWDGAQEAAKQLKEIYPGSGYGGLEFAREDKFANAYSGKHYVGQGNFELLTMGVQALMGGSSGEVLDLEYRRWVLGMLALL